MMRHVACGVCVVLAFGFTAFGCFVKSFSEHVGIGTVQSSQRVIQSCQDCAHYDQDHFCEMWYTYDCSYWHTVYDLQNNSTCTIDGTTQMAIGTSVKLIDEGSGTCESNVDGPRNWFISAIVFSGLALIVLACILRLLAKHMQETCFKELQKDDNTINFI